MLPVGRPRGQGRRVADRGTKVSSVASSLRPERSDPTRPRLWRGGPGRRSTGWGVSGCRTTAVRPGPRPRPGPGSRQPGRAHPRARAACPAGRPPAPPRPGRARPGSTGLTAATTGAGEHRQRPAAASRDAVLSFAIGLLVASRPRPPHRGPTGPRAEAAKDLSGRDQGHPHRSRRLRRSCADGCGTKVPGQGGAPRVDLDRSGGDSR